MGWWEHEYCPHCGECWTCNAGHRCYTLTMLDPSPCPCCERKARMARSKTCLESENRSTDLGESLGSRKLMTSKEKPEPESSSKKRVRSDIDRLLTRLAMTR